MKAMFQKNKISENLQVVYLFAEPQVKPEFNEGCTTGGGDAVNASYCDVVVNVGKCAEK